MSQQKRARVDSDESEFDSPEVKRLRDDLLSNSDDSDVFPTSVDLDSFMRTFENEIAPAPAEPATAPDLGFLLGASDDELGIPPATSEERVFTESLNYRDANEMWNEIPSYDSFEIYGDGYEVYDDPGYEYSDLSSLGNSGIDLYEDVPIALWRPETAL